MQTAVIGELTVKVLKARPSGIVWCNISFRIYAAVLKIIHIYFSIKGFVRKAMLEKNRDAGRGSIPARCVGSRLCQLNLLGKKIQ